MTLTSRIKIAIIALLVALTATWGAALIGYNAVRADGSAETALPDAGSASAPTADATPADKLHDPLASPKAAFDDVKAAKKTGWAIAVFAILVMLTKLAGRLGGKYKALAILGKGRVAVVVGAVGALSMACYNAAAEGGAWTAMLMAGLVALGHYINASPKEA